jgi:hypothetical protein
MGLWGARLRLSLSLLLCCRRPDWQIAMKAAVTLALALATITWAQFNPAHPEHQVSKARSTSPAKRQLSPKEQFWCPVLKSALSGAPAAEPPVRSYLLETIAGGLSKCDPRKVRTVLVDSFTATLAMPENEEEINQRTHRFVSEGERIDQATLEAIYNLETKQRLQEAALNALLVVDESKVESFLSQAEPRVSAELLSSMISRATSAKKFDRALDLLNRVTPKDRFPYEDATQLMLALPPERDTDRQEIFRLAMARDQEWHSPGISSDDFASMIVRFWQHIPPTLALAAIHQVLDGAQPGEGTGVTLNSASGRAGFTSEHDYRVFELLPVLRQLDDDEADKILKDSQQAQIQLKQFPNGIQSIDPTIRDTPLKEGETGHALETSVGPPNEMEQTFQTNRARVQEIGRMAEDNPHQAIAAATTLPDSVGKSWRAEFPRSQAYLAIARSVMKKNPSAAKDALEEMAASLEHAPYPYHAMENWIEGLAIARELGDVDLAVKLFRSGMEQADKLRSEDADSDDPNLALKAWWPSVSAYWRLVQAASRFSSRTALDQVREIKDPEILLLLEVKLANNALGARAEESITMLQKKTSHNSWSEFRLPEIPGPEK